MPAAVSVASYRALAEVRFRIREFLAFSEAEARTAGVEPQQHQLLLAIRGLPAGDVATIGRIAERLHIQHHSAVELVRRAVQNGLVRKEPGSRDRREVLLAVTPQGAELLETLARAHRKELRSLVPALVEALTVLVDDERGDRKNETAKGMR